VHAQGEYWATHCDFSSFLQPEPPFISALEELEALGLKLCIFTNGPRAYALKVLERLEVKRFFADERIFAVEDVLPACKPEPAAFNKVPVFPVHYLTRCAPSTELHQRSCLSTRALDPFVLGRCWKGLGQSLSEL
jgi:hypothetical protein